MTDIRPAGRDAATEAMIAAVLADEDRYPNGVSFVGRDDAGFETIVAGLVHEGATFVVVARDGSETLYAPTHA